MTMAKKKLKITLKKSPIARPPKHRATIKGLGLKRLHQTVVKPNVPQIRGMVKQVIHMVEVEEED
jgi:large subunit ribosomal protein L30